jgi:hypothetical protein
VAKLVWVIRVRGGEERMPGLASISIDLDGLPHYAALHGLSPEVVSAEARGLVHRVAVPRFAELVEGAVAAARSS